jgi:glutamate racemase
VTSAPPAAKKPFEDNRPIGLFDSGIGGLTILRSLMSALPNESFIYLGDTARLPYGSKSPETIKRYVKQNMTLLGNLDVKGVVVACNSASTVLLDKDTEFPVPIYNVIEPGAESALQVSTTKRIGVIGTNATVHAHAYGHVLQKLDSNCTVFSRACPLLVPLVEEGWVDDPITNLIIYRYVSPLLANGIDTLILGCTHYPALRGGIGRVVGPTVSLVDSSEAITDRMLADMAGGHFGKSTQRSLIRVLTTDVSPVFTDVATRLMAPQLLPNIELVNL